MMAELEKSLGWELRTFAQKTSTAQIFVIVCLQSDNELPMSEMQKIGGSLTSFSK